MPSQDAPRPLRPGLFPRTPWGEVTHSARAAEARRRRAHEEFCRTYWWPIFGLITRRGYGVADAQDLTQDFLLHFLGSGALTRARPDRGRFRDFLGGSLRHYLINREARARARKRGGDLIAVGVEALERIPAPAPTDADTAWTAALVARALDRVRQSYRAERRPLFDALQPYLVDEPDTPPPYAKLVCRLRRTPGTLRSEMKRLRENFRAELRRELRGEGQLLPGR